MLALAYNFSFRTICQDIIFLDFDYAARMSVGKRLWDAHIMINGRYRKLLDRYRKGDQKKLVVERRKVEKHYADFLKTSQVFYRGYVQRLASHYGGMPRLVRIAACLSLDLASVEQPVTVSDDTARLLESSCHAHLLRLGDLSRYRNMIRTTKRTWEPALGYYSLANELCPESGTAHNQMAIIFLADQDHLDAIYHLYRAATAIEPHPLARGNLELEFKKIIGVWEKHRAKPKMDALETLVWWFVILHAKFYDGAIFSTQKELENEVLSRLNLLLQEQSIDDTLHKLVLISISAQSTAITRINGK
jgi:tetratricopeptide (TPR) repeat protein